MCTSIALRKKNHYFGRTLDVEFTYNEQVVITPRSYRFQLRNGTEYRTSYALIGMAAVMEGYPLYYEASNEKGLAMAGLNFPGNAFYQKARPGMDNICVFELIPWILGQAENLAQARELFEKLNLTDTSFAPGLPTAPLHYMVSDKTGSIVVEPREHGLEIYENPTDVMTNNPPFPYHLWNLPRYRTLSPDNGENRFAPGCKLDAYAVGMGAEGLPGDCSSTSRFVRAAFNLANSNTGDGEDECVTQFFHVLDSVSMVKGAVHTDDGKDDITLYSCCINTDEGIYYYKTYTNSQITAIRLHRADLDGKELVVFPLHNKQQYLYDN